MEFTIAHLVIVFIIILLSMTLHEAMHAFASYWLGDDTARRDGRLTLNPLAHIDPFLTIGLPLLLVVTALVTQTAVPIFGGAKPVPFNPYRVRYGEYGAALVGIAGPLTNFVLAFLFFAIYVVTGHPTGMVGDVLYMSVTINLGFFLFNILPIPPLDGSRVLYAFAPSPVRSFMEMIEQRGLLVVFLLIVLLSQPLSTFIVAGQNAIIQVFARIFGLSVI